MLRNFVLSLTPLAHARPTRRLHFVVAIMLILSALPISGSLSAKDPTIATSFAKQRSNSVGAPVTPAPGDIAQPRPATLSLAALPVPDFLRPYRVRAAEPNLLVLANALPSELAERVRQRQRDQLGTALNKLMAEGLAGAYAFDEEEGTFRATLSDAGRNELAGHPLVAAIEPESTSAPGVETKRNEQAPMVPLPANIVVQSVSSVVFVQVYSPFVWGRTNIGGLAVALTLEQSNGITKGVPSQTFSPAPNNYVKIDRTQLYFETIFVDPNTRTPVMILPGDRVHVVTSGDDPGTPYPDPAEDKRVIVDDVRAWTSYEQDSVGGTVPPNSEIIVTVGPANLSKYLTPGSFMTYAELRAGSDGRFSAPSFRTSANPAYKKTNLEQGSTGFVRVRHADGNEVYTVHGQNVFVLENSWVLHGYAAPLPPAPTGLDAGVALARPRTSVAATLKNSQGQIKESASIDINLFQPYTIEFGNANILGGDLVEVSINQAPPVQVTVAPLTAAVDLSGNRVTGTGPANTQMVLGAGRIRGYITASSTFDYVEQRMTTNAAGSYTSERFQCGNSNYLTLQPGGFGYAGYEDSRGNFVYVDFAVPTNHVMADYPFLEGWIANGMVRPAVSVRDGQGTLKDQVTASPLLLWMTNQKLYVNTYYHVTTSNFIVPGDTVAITSGGQSYTIPVDRITAYVNTDTETIVGEAPAGATVRVVPADDPAARREVVADANGVYSAGNPFTYLNNYSCIETSKTEDFAPGDAGRAYTRHADGSEVYAAYGQSMHVNENENYVELYLYVFQNLDWWGLPPRGQATLTLTPKQGAPVTVQATADAGRPGKTRLYIIDAQGRKVLIRAGDSLTATFDIGPSGLARPVTIAMNSLALVTGSPDIDTSTLAGVGPRGWGGQATLNPPAGAKPSVIPPSAYTAYSPLRFVSLSNSPITLERGYSGVVSFSNTTGHRVWVAWAVTNYQVKIMGRLRPGDTQVCGKAPPGTMVRIHDVTRETEDVIIATGSADAQGNFCVTVSPLHQDQVLMAEAEGTYSQPVVVGMVFDAYLPFIVK